MSKYYIRDSNNNIQYYTTVPDVVVALEHICRKITRQNRTTFMIEMISLGHGYDDTDGAYFTELMADKVEVGVLGRDGRHKRCNIHEQARNLKYRVEMGD